MSVVLELDFQHDAIRCIPGHLPKSRISDCILMQYTGLKDKNGVEIYEGDILSFSPFSNEVVFWEKSYWALGKENGWSYPLYLMDSTQWEIIGNIYQNTELLELT